MNQPNQVVGGYTYPNQPIQHTQYPYNQAVSNVYYAPQPAPVMMNAAPIASQPINTTQCGITYDQLRNDMANYIVAHQNDDVAALQLAKDSAGIHQNWLTGKMDSIVNMFGVTMDFMYSQTPGMDFNQMYNSALEEVYRCAWANMMELNPSLFNDPSIAPKAGIVNEWNQIKVTRYNTFKQLGLVNNNPVQNVQPWNTTGFANGIPQIRHPVANIGYPTMQKPIQPAQLTMAPKFVSSNRPGYAQADFQQNTSRSNTETTDQRAARIYREIKQNEERYAHLGDDVVRDKYGNIMFDEYGNPILRVGSKSNPDVHNKYTSNQQHVNQPQHADISNINQVPHRPSVFESMKHPSESVRDRLAAINPDAYQEAMRRQENTNQQLNQNTAVTNEAPVSTWMSQAKPSTTANVTGVADVKPTYDVKTFDLSDVEHTAAVFKQIIQNDAKENPGTASGLQADEVRYLTLQERGEFYKKGVKFEYPYTAPIACQPALYAVHAILTVNNTVRQVVTPLDELDGAEMRRPAHEDIFADLRKDPAVTRDPNATKHNTSTYMETTIGGVVFDRFKQSKVVLAEGLKLAVDSTESDTPERKEAVYKAFDAYQEQIEKDHYDAVSGLAQHRILNPIEEGEEDFEDPIMGAEETDRRYKFASTLVRPEESDDIIAVGGLTDVMSRFMLDEITTNTPIEEANSKLVTYSQTQVLRVFNHPKELEEVKDKLKRLHWETEITNKEEQNNFSAEKMAEVLLEVRDEVPIQIWERLNSIATDEVNLAIEHILGIPRLTIDSFAEDYADLIVYLAEHFGDVPNISPAVATMDNNVCIALQRLHATDEYVAEDENGLDLVQLRTLTAVLHHRVLHLPITSKSIGFTEDEIIVTRDLDNGLFNICEDMIRDQLASRVSRIKHKCPINGNYVAFSDGRIYRVFARIGENATATTSADNLLERVAFVRMYNV